MARNSLLCADVPLRNYSLTHSQRDSSNIINMTLNVTINTIIIKFYIELFSPFFRHFTWQLKGKIQLTIFDRSNIDCASLAIKSSNTEQPW